MTAYQSGMGSFLPKKTCYTLLLGGLHAWKILVMYWTNIGGAQGPYLFFSKSSVHSNEINYEEHHLIQLIYPFTNQLLAVEAISPTRV
jgi:hypothetical protein